MNFFIPAIGSLLYFNYKSALDKPLNKPISNVSIIMPVYNEEQNLHSTLNSLKEQTIIKEYPNSFEMIVVDCNSEDLSREIAHDFSSDVYTINEREVLTARIKGIKESNGDIIVSTNGDTYYPPTWLNNVLSHFNKNNVVGVASPAFYYDLPELNLAFKLLKPFNDDRRMRGCSSAFTIDAYNITGGFDTKIDQSISDQLQFEEEVLFRKRLNEIGKIDFEYTPVFTSPRRYTCNINKLDSYCTELTNGTRFSGYA